MKIEKQNLVWHLYGDIHGVLPQCLSLPIEEEQQAAIILLGDAGVNYYGEYSNKDIRLKEQLNASGNIFYLVKGNHESRPENLSDIEFIYDPNVKGNVYVQPQFPNIRYFDMVGDYNIDGYKTLVIGGAYSIDKFYRLERGWNWFADEQLTEDEMVYARGLSDLYTYDLILSHTCPHRWEPVDLFLPQVDQSKVDKTMEFFLDEIMWQQPTASWCWGHYHDDRIMGPSGNYRMFYNDLATLDEVMGDNQ